MILNVIEDFTIKIYGVIINKLTYNFIFKDNYISTRDEMKFSVIFQDVINLCQINMKLQSLSWVWQYIMEILIVINQNNADDIIFNDNKFSSLVIIVHSLKCKLKEGNNDL